MIRPSNIFAATFCCLAFSIGSLVLGQSSAPAVFVTNNVGDSVSSFIVNNDGTIALVGNYVAGDSPQCISLSPDGRFLAVAHGTVSSTTELLIVYAVNADASLTQAGSIQTPDSPLNCAWLTNTILSVTQTSLSQDNAIITYEWNESLATLTQVDMQFTGTFNTSLSAFVDGNLVFANDSFGDQIFSFDFDSGGVLTLNEAQTTGTIFPVAIKVSPDGKFLYGAGGISGSGNEILAFSVDDTGQMDPTVGAQSPGASPKVIGLTDDGTVLVAGHGGDGTARSFLRDPITGLLTPTNFSVGTGGQGNLGDLQVMGDLLFVTDESTSSDGQRGLLSIRINADGSFTQLGPIVDAGESRPEYIATWRGASELFVQPDSYNPFRGILVGGTLAETLDSDDQYLRFNPGFTINSTEAPVWLEFQGTIVETPPALGIFVESQAGTPGLAFTIEAFNWPSQSYDTIQAFDETFNVDSVVAVDISSGTSDYVTPASGQVLSRIGWRQQSFTINFPWEIRLDQFGWSVQ